MPLKEKRNPTKTLLDQPAGAAEYTDYFSAEGSDSPIECPGHNTKQSDGEATEMLKLWGIWSIASLPSLPDPLWPRVVAPDRVLPMGQIELKPCNYTKLNYLKLTVFYI